MAVANKTGFIVNPIIGADIAERVIDGMEDGTLYIIGPGDASQSIMTELKLPASLFGVDVVLDRQLIASDVSENVLWNLIQGFKDHIRAVITFVGGQGNVFGWSIQQLSPRIIRFIGRENLIFISDRANPAMLPGSLLLAETGDPELDEELCSVMEVAMESSECSMRMTGN